MKISVVFLIFIDPVFSNFVMNFCVYAAINKINKTLNIVHCFDRSNFEDGRRSRHQSLSGVNKIEYLTLMWLLSSRSGSQYTLML
jgi:hypothetical protein